MATLLTAACSSAVVGSTFMLQLGVRHENLGIATSLLSAVRVAGGAIATAIYSSILNNQLISNIQSTVARDLDKAGVPISDIQETIEALLQGSGSSPVLQSLSPVILDIAKFELKQAFARAFRVVYLVSIAFGVLGTICAAFSLDVSHLMTVDIDVQLGKPQAIKIDPVNETVKSIPPKPYVGYIEQVQSLE